MNAPTNTIKRGRKFDQVLAGAREVFMTDGFEGASVDTIARAAGVSKATLYSYFSDKKQLFAEVARTECRRQADEALTQINTSGPPEMVLRQAGRHMMRFFLSDFGQRVFRICVAEADRFPDLGCQFYDSGPRVVEEALTSYFDLAIARGELAIDDRPLAAHQFAELCKAMLFSKVVFGVQTRFDEAEQDRILSGAVEMFLARYGGSGVPADAPAPPAD